MNRTLYQSVPKYLAAIRSKVAEFGREALTAYSEPGALAIGFRCGSELHVVGLSHIRAHYNIERVLPNITGVVQVRRNPAPPISQEDGIAMFISDCKKALQGQ
jgi:hypothetical protein